MDTQLPDNNVDGIGGAGRGGRSRTCSYHTDHKNDIPSFYRRGFTRTELEDLCRLQDTGVTEEIILLRVIIRRAFEYALERDDVKEALAFVNTIGNACTRLTQMVAAQKKLAEAPSELAGAITQALEEVIAELGVMP
ncbi:MAG: hypothetical protein GYA34_07290 [Chloroflexi bacterium]|nr:hypothetical protein [Chloroflexota bacterium]